MFKKVKGWRTRTFAYVIGTLGIVQMYIPQIVSPEHQGMVLMGIALTVYWLRQITSTPPGRNE